MIYYFLNSLVYLIGLSYRLLDTRWHNFVKHVTLFFTDTLGYGYVYGLTLMFCCAGFRSVDILISNLLGSLFSFSFFM